MAAFPRDANFPIIVIERWREVYPNAEIGVMIGWIEHPLLKDQDYRTAKEMIRATNEALRSFAARPQSEQKDLIRRYNEAQKQAA